MFEITSDDISLLTDEDLRTLVGLLCESEVRSREISTSFVTWGGNQNAVDGGIDVRVALPDGSRIDGFVPRRATGFQVKKSDMPRAEILSEMRPEGSLRPAIRDLADRSGAYVIVSSGSSTADTSLQSRRSAMKEAVKDLPNAASLSLDFYDSGRLASWVRDHMGLVAWVKEKTAHSIRGWQSYGSWTFGPEGVAGEYLLDESLRIRTNTETEVDGFRPLDGIERIRKLLSQPRTVVRLVGLSGVGKTRLVQALFDNRIGSENLDQTFAAYTNIADGPDPEPNSLISDLVASREIVPILVESGSSRLFARYATCSC